MAILPILTNFEKLDCMAHLESGEPAQGVSFRRMVQNLVLLFFHFTDLPPHNFRKTFDYVMAIVLSSSGMGLNDSPIGLAAYIMEKFSTWTNRDWRNLPDGGLLRYDNMAR